MSEFTITRKINFNKSFRNQSVIDKFDLSINNYTERFNGNIDLKNKEWNIGIIVGNSGTGKTTIAKELFGDNIMSSYNFNSNNSVLEDMPNNKTVEEITKIFNKVGFSSPPSWLKPYCVLSNGEKMRVELAYNLLSDNKIFCFDEFTSVVDRNVAKVTSTCIQKSVRNLNKQFIAVSCHFDIIDWLEPDWIFDTNTMQFFFTQNAISLQDQKLTLRYIQQNQMNYGKFLKNITI